MRKQGQNKINLLIKNSCYILTKKRQKNKSVDFLSILIIG